MILNAGFKAAIERTVSTVRRVLATKPHDKGYNGTVSAASRRTAVVLDASRRLDSARQVELGQFMTPAPTARLMASMFDARAERIRVLDAGAGVGSLTAVWVVEICSR